MKILVRAPNWVGDAVMAIPALEALRRAFPDGEIATLARPAVADLYRGQKWTNRVLEFDFHGRHRGWFGRERLAAELRCQRFDIALLLQNAFEAAWLVWRAGIPERVGYAREGRRLLLTKAIPVPPPQALDAMHESRYFLGLLRHAGWTDSDAEIPAAGIEVTQAARDAAEQTLLQAGARLGSWRCAVAPGAAYGAAKCWLPERFAALADRLISQCDADVIFFGTPAETEIVSRIAAAMSRPAITLVGKTSLRDLPGLLSACSAFIGNDSGAMHVAAAVGLPVVGIFGPTDPVRTAPLTRQFTLIQEPVSCSPCFLRACPIDHRCMTRIQVDRVFEAAQVLRPSANLSKSGGTGNE
jgi:lipopolysaccharide heptosyltransferase II